MSELRTGTPTSVGGGGYEKILGAPPCSGEAVKVAPRGADGTKRDPSLQPREGFTNATRFSESEFHDIVAARDILGGAFPSLKGPRDVVWPRL